MLERSQIAAALDRAATDPEFAALAGHLDSTIRIGGPSGGWIVGFSRGVASEPLADDDPTLRWDYELIAGEEDWQRLVDGEVTFPQALGGIGAKVTIRGDLVRVGGDTEALGRLFELLPENPPSVDRPASGEWTEGSFDPVGRYLMVGDIRTYYEEFPGPAERTFLLIHTAGHDGRQLEPLAALLAEHGQVYLPDLPGHGKTWPTGTGAFDTADGLRAFIWDFRSAAGISGPTIVVGCSLGGNLALALGVDHPEEVAAVVAFQGADFTPTQTRTTLALLDHPRINPGHYGILRTRALIGSRTPRDAAALIEWGTRAFTSPVVQSDLLAYGNFDLRDRMGEVTCPVLLVHGEDDWLVTREMVEQTAERLVAAEPLEVLHPDGIGHYAPIEQPLEMAAAVTGFLRRSGVLGA